MAAVAAFAVYVAAAGISAGSASAGTWDDLAWMYRPSEVVDIHLTLDDDQKALLNSNDELRPWVGGVGFWMTGSEGRSFASPGTPWQIEAKLKGHSTFRFLDGKAAFNLKFPKSSRPDGLKRITLNNMVKDPTYLRETTTYDVLRASDIPAPRTGYARLWVNDEYYGVYLNLEKYNDQSLEHWFPNTQHLYEAIRTHDIVRSGDDLKQGFEVDEGDEEDWADLESLSAAVRTGQWTEIQAHLASPERAIRLLAAEWYLGHWDGYGWARRNYYLHSDGDGLFTLLPAGTDMALRPPFRDNYDLSFPLASAADGWNQPDGAAAIVDACFADPACSDQFIHELENVRQAAAGLDLATTVTERAAALTPLIESDPRKEFTMRFVQRWQSALLPYLDAQDSQAAQLLRTHPLTMHSPEITLAPEAVTTATDATFEFGHGLDETQGVLGFQCRFDGGELSPCTSPVTYEDLAIGEHDFAVRAINDGDTPGPVTTHAWTVNPPRQSLAVDKIGDGTGSVNADPAGPEYDAGTEVTLTATPSPGSTFAGWSGCDSVSVDGDCLVVTTDEVKLVTAEFALAEPPPKFTLTVNEIGDGSGSVSADPAGPEYDAGTEVTLTATPSPGSTFAGWSGCDSVDIDGTCVVTMDEAETVTAEFAAAKPVITATTPPSPANDNLPYVKGTLPTTGTLGDVRIYTNGSCSGQQALKRSAAKFTGTGIPTSVPDNTTTTFTANVVIDGTISACSDPFTYVEDSAAPETTIDSGPSGSTDDATPTFGFSSEPGSSFQCRFDAASFGPCSGPGNTHTPANDLAAGAHVFEVRAVDEAGNSDPTAASRSFTVEGGPPPPTPRPVITGTTPPSPANNNLPYVKGTLPTTGTLGDVRIYTNGSCSGQQALKRSAAKFTGTGIPTSVPDNTTTTFTANVVIDGTISACSDPFTYVEDSSLP